jgi:deoxyribose-phosphate aldolase
MINPEKIAKMIDHTNVKPTATYTDIKKLCTEAKKYNFSCACVTPTNVSIAKSFLKDSEVQVCVVVGFPFGTNTSHIKSYETTEALKNGASEIDMVINLGALKSGKYDVVREDVEQVVKAAKSKIIKVIIETSVLKKTEKIQACLIAKETGANFVKTSTGVIYPGANVEDVALLRRTIGSEMGIKASGGIRDLKTVLSMIKAGATKIGTSTGVQIMEELLKIS